MSNTLLVKRTTVAGRVPTTAQLLAGELAVNVPDGKLYLKQEGSAVGIVEVGAVRSVAGRTGDVALAVGDVAGAAALASPALSGTPTAPTPATGDSSTRLATTEFVKAQGYITTATAGVSSVSGTAPIVSSGGSTPILSILAASTSSPGAMSAADKTKLDGIAAGAQVNVATNLGITGTGNSRTITSSTGTNVTIPVATSSTAGFMATGDKSKLDGIAAGAQVNEATNLGYSAAATSGTVTSSTGSNATLPAATTSLAGLLTSADKAKLDGIAAGAQVNVATNLGYSAAAASGAVTSSTGSHATLPAATTSLAGLLSSADKAKLDGIAAGAQVNVATNLGVAGGTTGGPTITSSTGSNVTLPTASTTASGVVTTGTQSWAGAKTFTGVVTAPDFVTTSDARLKREIAPICDALAKLQCLQGVTFEMADDPRRRMGLLAQEVQAVAPEAVIETEGVLRLAYGNLLGLLVEAIKDLSRQVDQLKGTKP